MNRHIAILAIAALTCTTGQAKALAVPDEDAATLKVSQLIRNYDLTSDRIDCLDFEITDKGSRYLVRVREKHSPECDGDPTVSPTLFFLQIRKSDGHAWTLDYMTGNIVPLRKPKQ